MIRILAPAKINLGLEILGKRADGFHEINSILCAVSVFDHLGVEPGGPGGLIIDDQNLSRDNLVLRARDLAAKAHLTVESLTMQIHKRIPVAAGLGGASSDAAAALLALQRLARDAVDECTLPALASKLGSDVPFFLRAGLAKASGRGESLRPLPHQRIDVVIIHPAVAIPDKTATMYGMLDQSDFSDGSAVDNLASLLSRLAKLPEAALPNAFFRPLYSLEPELMDFARRIGEVSELPVQLSGAGPAHFVVCRDVEHRQWVRNRLRGKLTGANVRVLTGRSVPSVLVREA